MPVKDEVTLIKYSLPALYSLDPDEIILVVEPLSTLLKTISSIAALFPQTSLKTIVLRQPTPNWRDRHAYARRLGFIAARNDTIFTIDVDKVADPRIVDYLSLLREKHIGLVCFNEVPKGFSYDFLLLRVLRNLGYEGSFTGTYAFSRSSWLQTEEEEDAKQIFTGEDTNLHECMRRKFGTVFVKETKVLVLRPCVKKLYQYLAGVERRRHGRSFIKVLISSILFCRPTMLVGFLKGKKLISKSRRFR